MSEKRVHIAGIGGVGMSALAQALLDRGVNVSGSDRIVDQGATTPTLTCLAAQGVKIYPQDNSAIDSECKNLIVSTAIEKNNPEVVRAQELGIPIEHRMEALTALLTDRRVVAVSGTCGKSSVTALLGWILQQTGFDPLVINGAALCDWNQGGKRIGSVYSGQGAWCVVEADESDRSLLRLSPEHAIITNISADHFSLAESESLFQEFRQKVRATMIDGSVEQDTPQNMRLEGWNGCFTLNQVEYCVPLPGEHNIWNAWHAVRMALLLGAEPHALQSALSGFGGIERRLQLIGSCNGAAVIDDYAHNPVKIGAAWRTLSRVFPNGICGIWRPHGYAPLRKMLDELANTLIDVCGKSDTLLLLPVYDAGGSADRSINSDVLASMLRAHNVTVWNVSSLEEAAIIMQKQAAVGKALVTLGARDPGLPKLAQQLAGI